MRVPYNFDFPLDWWSNVKKKLLRVLFNFSTKIKAFRWLTPCESARWQNLTAITHQRLCWYILKRNEVFEFKIKTKNVLLSMSIEYVREINLSVWLTETVKLYYNDIVSNYLYFSKKRHFYVGIFLTLSSNMFEL